MSNTKDNVLTRTYSGKFGNQLVFRNRGDMSIISKPQKKSLKSASESQLQVRHKFKIASRWAKEALQDPATLASYTAMASGMKSPYVIAVTNYLCPPEIKQIITSGYTGNTGDTIRVVVAGDFMVTGVHVRIKDASGGDIEQGPCTEDLSADCWVFTADKTITGIKGLTVTAEAFDVPNHAGSLQVTL
ncbi:MAG: hypothetical protein WCO44_07430 [Bacteroidota bacterium]